MLAAARAQEDAREWTFVRRDGSRLPAARTISPIADTSGAIVGYAGLARDISRRRRVEEEQEAVRRVAIFVAGEAEAADVFARVAQEAGGLLGADASGVLRFDGTQGTQVGSWAATPAAELPVGFTDPARARRAPRARSPAPGAAPASTTSTRSPTPTWSSGIGGACPRPGPSWPAPSACAAASGERSGPAR